MKPRDEASSLGYYSKVEQPFSLRTKRFYEASANQVENIFKDQFALDICMPVYGLLFQPISKVIIEYISPNNYNKYLILRLLLLVKLYQYNISFVRY